MTENKRFTTVELPKPNRWGIWYDGAYLSTYQVCILLNEYVDVKKENEQLKRKMNYTRIVIRNNLPKEMVCRVEKGLQKMENELKGDVE